MPRANGSHRVAETGVAEREEASPVEARWVVAAVLAALVAGLAAVHVWWLVRFRRGFPVDIDEAGYLWFAYHLRDRLGADGLDGLWQRIQGEGWVGPLLPSVTALVQALGAPEGVVPAMAVQLLFFAVLVGASYGIGSKLLDRRAGMLTAVVVASLPAVTDFARTYHLALASAATYALATYALLASDRLRNRWWTVGWGLALGLMLLTRSMVIAFVPALPLAAGWMLLVDRADRRRVVSFALGLGVAAVVALQWYASSWRAIWDYLFAFGYGEQTPGPTRSVLSPEFWTDEVVGAIDVGLYVPLAAVLAAALALSAMSAVTGRRRSPTGEWPRRAVRSDAVVPAFVVAEGYLALSSSANDGTGFVVPLLPSLVALSVVALLRVRWSVVRGVLVSALLAVSAFNVLMKADIHDSASEARSVHLPGLGRATVTNGRGFLHQHLVNEAGYALGPPTAWLPERERGWRPLFEQALASLDRLPVQELRLYLATSEPVLNSSAVRLASVQGGRSGGIFEPIDTGGEDTVAAYRRFLAEAGANAVLTTSRQGWHFGSHVTQPRVASAASSLGLRVVARFELPDRRELRVWACCEPGRRAAGD